MASLIYCSSLRVLEKRIAEAAEALNDIRRQPDLSLEKVQIVCKTWSGLMLKMELDTRTLSCSQEEKEVLVALNERALHAADILALRIHCTTVGDSKGVMDLVRMLVRMLVICHTIYVEANTVGAVVQTLGEIDEITTETLWIGTIKVQLWTARRELEDAMYRIGGLENIRGMRVIISKIEDGLSRLQQDANALNYMVMKIGEGVLKNTPTIVGDINITYTRAIRELEAMTPELCRSGTSLTDQQETLRFWVEEKISTLIFLPPHSVPFPKAGEFYTFNY